MDNKISFTAYLNDMVSGTWNKLTAKTNSATSLINKDLGKISDSGKRVARSLDEIDNRLNDLQKRRKLSVNVDEIRSASREIKTLEKEKSRIDGMGNKKGIGANLGGLAKGFLVGAAIATVASIQPIGEAIVETTAKYQKFEAVLSTTLGNKGQAIQIMDQIVQFASKTPFQVDELTESWVKLANQGFRPSMQELTSLGDLAASTGKNFDQLAEAVIDAQTGEYERLKEFGIRASKDGDKVKFTFKEQTKVVDNTASSIRSYILSLGNAAGVSGSMEAISRTTGGQISNMHDNVDQLWKALGERLQPGISNTVGSLSSMVATVKDWVAIPVEQKVNAEVGKIRALQTELTSANTTETRRKEILHELEQINPKITQGINAQNIEYNKLAQNIDKVVGAMREKILLDTLQKEFGDKYSKYIELQTEKEQKRAALLSKVYEVNPNIATANNMTDEEKINSAIGESGKFYEAERQKVITGKITQAQWEQFLEQNKGKLSLVGHKYEVKELQKLDEDITRLQPEIDHMQKKKNALSSKIDETLSITDSGKNNKKESLLSKDGISSKTDKTQRTDSAGLSSVTGGSPIKNLYITINNLVSGGINIHTTTLQESAAKAKDIVVEALLTAVNDTNLAGGI